MDSDMPTVEYDLAAIRRLMRAGFTAKQLRRFCQDRPLFRHVVEDFGADAGINDMVDEVIDFCRTRVLLDELLAEVEKSNPRQYERHKAQLRLSKVEDAAPSQPDLGEPAQPSPTLRITYPEGEFTTVEWASVRGVGGQDGRHVLLVNLVVGNRCYLQPESAVPDEHGFWLHPKCRLSASGIERRVYALSVSQDDVDKVQKLFVERIHTIAELEGRLGAASIDYEISGSKRLVRFSEADAKASRQAIRITGIDCYPLEINRYQTMSLSFTIINSGPPHQVWLGATILDQSGSEFFNTDQDELVELGHGRGIYRRFLTIPREATPGTYRVVGGVWLGQRGEPSKSRRVAGMDRGFILSVLA